MTVRSISVTSSGRSSIEQHDDVAFGMIAQNAVGDLLQEDGLAGARRGDDQAALALADRRDQVDDAHVDLLSARLRG